MSIPKTDKNRVELVGEIAGEPVLRSFDSATLLSFSVRTRVAGQADNVPVAWWDPATALEAGQRVRVVGKMRRRFFGGPSGTRSAVEVVADAVTVT